MPHDSFCGWWSKVDKRDFELVATLENDQRATKIHEWILSSLSTQPSTAEMCSNRLMLLCSVAGICRVWMSLFDRVGQI